MHIQLRLGESILSSTVCFSFILYPASASVSIPSQSPFSCPLITPAWAVSMATKSAPGLYTLCLSLCFLFSLLVFFCSVGASQPSAASLSVRSLFYLFIYLMILPFFPCLGCDVEGHFFAWGDGRCLLCWVITWMAVLLLLISLPFSYFLVNILAVFYINLSFHSPFCPYKRDVFEFAMGRLSSDT